MDYKSFDMDIDPEWMLAEHKLGSAIMERLVQDLLPPDKRSLAVTDADAKDAINWVLDTDDGDGTFLWWTQHLRISDRVRKCIIKMALDLREQI